MNGDRKEPEPQHTYRYCHCGRRLRAGELCAESYDGHKPRSDQAIVAEGWARFDEAVPE